MQFDMFGGSEEVSVNETSAPVLTGSGAWVSPETLIFNAALKRGSLADAVAVLKALKTPAVVGVLLASGFAVADTKDRDKLISFVQSEIVAAARLQLTGMELRAVRWAEKAVDAERSSADEFNPRDYAVAFMPAAEVGDFITHEDGFNYVVDSAAKEVHAIRPLTADERNNRMATRNLSPDAAKIAKQRYVVERARAVKNEWPVVTTADAFTNLIESTFEPSLRMPVRVDGLVYTISGEGSSPSSAIDVERVVLEADGVKRVDALSLSRDEVLAARRAFFPDVASFNLSLAMSLMPEITPVVETVVEKLGSPAVAMTLDRRTNLMEVTAESSLKLAQSQRLVDAAGKEYQTFSIRGDRLEVFPVGADGKAEVFAGNSVFFHLNPDSAQAFPHRRHDSLFTFSEINVALSPEVGHTSVIENAITAPIKESDDVGATVQPGILRSGVGGGDRESGASDSLDSESLAAGMAAGSSSLAGRGDVPGLAGQAAGVGVGRDDGAESLVASVVYREVADERSVVDASGERAGRGVTGQVEGFVSIPEALSAAVAADFAGQAKRAMRLRNETKRPGLNLNDKLSLQADARQADTTLHDMRLSVFDVEDSILAAIEAKDPARFALHSVTFPSVQKKLVSYIAELGLSEGKAKVADDRVWNTTEFGGVEHTVSSGPVNEYRFNGGLEFAGSELLPELDQFYRQSVVDALPPAVVSFIQKEVRDRMQWYEKEFGIIASPNDAMAPDPAPVLSKMAAEVTADAPVVVRHAWEIPSLEFSQGRQANPFFDQHYPPGSGDAPYLRDVKEFHENAVRQAVAQGLAVPERVLEEYPKIAASQAKPWHTLIPEAGLPVLDDEEVGDGYRRVAHRVAAEAVQALTPVQKSSYAQFYSYLLPAAGGFNGRVRLLPDDQEKPVGWSLLNPGAYRPQAQSVEAMTSRMAHELANEPILGDRKLLKVTDKNIGLSWDTVHGKAVITSLVSPAKPEFGMKDMYEYKTQNGYEFRVYEDAIADTIERNEFDASPEGRAKHAASVVAYAENEKARAALAEKNAIDQAALEAKLDGFIAASGYPAMKSGLARKTLLSLVRYDKEVMRSFELVDKLVGGGAQISVTEEDRIKPMARRAFNRADNREQDAHDKRVAEAGKKPVYTLGEMALGKFEYDYASHVISKNVEVDRLDSVAVPVAAPAVASVMPDVAAPVAVPVLAEVAQLAGMRAKYPDSRTMPVVGDKVYTFARGFGGGRAGLSGEVAQGSNGLFVRITSSGGLLGERVSSKTAALSDDWTVLGEEHPLDVAARVSAERVKNEAETFARAHEEVLNSAAEKNGVLDPRTALLGDVLEMPDGQLVVVGERVGDDGLYVYPLAEPDEAPRGIGTDFSGVLSRRDVIVPADGRHLIREGGVTKAKFEDGYQAVDFEFEKNEYFRVRPLVLREPESLNVIRNPVEHGDWFKLQSGDHWQAMQGYSGRGWSLVKDKQLHPVVRNIDFQVDLIRAVLSVAVQKDVRKVQVVASDGVGVALTDAASKRLEQKINVFTLMRDDAAKQLTEKNIPEHRKQNLLEKLANRQKLVDGFTVELAAHRASIGVTDVPLASVGDLAGGSSGVMGGSVGLNSVAGTESVAPVRSLYPFGETAIEDRFHGSRVRVLPELRGDVAWEGTVSLALNGGRLISVKRNARVDDGRDFMPVRISGDRIEVLELRDSGVVGVGRKEASMEATGALASVGSDSLGVAEVQSAAAAPVDYVLTDADRIGLGGLGEKYRDNVAAIRVLRAIAAENRHAVGDELGTLARYVGWGGLKGVFDPKNKQWARQHLELRGLLNDAEWAAASRSQLDAFYTAPLVGKAMYSAVSRLGFDHGRVLEPSCGVGNFFGLMPENMRHASSLHGVELDILTSQIVAALYPSATIAKATGFQNYSVPAGYFDMAVGNVPFGSQAVVDDKGSVYSGWSIHNYFFAKSVEMLRPGGIMPMVISHNFLDKLDPHVRQWIARRAELVSAVRLPNSAFKENANTEVVTDILVFRRLDFENTLGTQETPDWLETTDVSIENPKSGEMEKFSVNNYFLKNPQNVMGVNSATGSMYKANEYTVESNGDLAAQLAQWVETLPQGIYTPIERSASHSVLEAAVVPDMVKVGSYFMVGDEVHKRLDDMGGVHQSEKWLALNGKATERMQGMIEIRQALREQIRLEQSNGGDHEIEQNRTQLNSLYDTFKKAHGFLNDSVNARLFYEDTEASLIQSLEFDYEKPLSKAKALEYGIEQRPARAVKADIFSRRVIFPPGEVKIVESAKDALLHSLNLTGGVDMTYMQQAYGKEEAVILKELGDLIFTDPVKGLVSADEYLSGDVKTKLAEVSKAAEKDLSLTRNVEALQAVIPKDKLPSEIYASIGAAWVPVGIYEQFAAEISGARRSFNYIAATGAWVKSGEGQLDLAKNCNEFGTGKMGAIDIFTQIMNSRAPEVTKKGMVDGKEVSVIDQEQTELVRQRLDKIKSHWDSWLWADGSRMDVLTKLYNDKFNRTVERKFDGSHLTLPGMSPAIKLLSHQKNGVWRGLQDRVMLMDQVVGAGKTFEGVALMMEMRRLGITKKPLIVVPNHLTLQWRTDFYRLYPAANILAATPKDFEKGNRELFFSKIVTGNWDAIIVGHSSLTKIAVPEKAERMVISEQLDDITKAIEQLKEARGDRGVVRDMEKIKSNLEGKIAKLQQKSGEKDKVVDFGDLGIDALFVDEMHEFKNLYFTTQMNRVAGLGNPKGSGKAFDMFVKVRWLQHTFGDKAPLITATGTPISNSLAEMFTMQRYMSYPKLKENNLHIFDAWAKQYGDVQNVYEVAPSGTGYRMSQRFSKFKNLSSLMGDYRSFADVVTLNDLKAQEIAQGKTFPVPKLAGGRPLNIVANRSELQEKFFGIPEIVRDDFGQIRFEVDISWPTTIVKNKEGRFIYSQDMMTEDGEKVTRISSKSWETEQEASYMTALAAITPVMKIDPDSIVGQFDNLRALTRATKGKINALSLTGLANKAGLDYRLIDPAAVDFPDSKVNIAVKNILETAKEWEKVNGTQLVFCDLSVPLSAKAKMASKDKRVFVRDDEGNVVHKMATLHTAKAHDGFPYFVVQVGTSAAKTFSIYDPLTGHLMKAGLDSKADAHELVKKALDREGGFEQWLDMREKSPVIESDELDDYKNDKGLNEDGEDKDIEISRDDIEGSTNVAGFSIYDDMKAKLVAGGMPASQIEFIHDHDTPQAKELLFKRVNSGEVRILFGSTPKMGAGTNVQTRLVALHHIDAPWRPSDLEQREGRIIRRGNMLYERDPEGFEIKVNRYATAQTYDTRRWQLLEHKAFGLEQLRNYAGVNEMEDVANEAANSADMKAAASGNPLILKETQLANEVKKLTLLERAHRDNDYTARSALASHKSYVSLAGPSALNDLELLKNKRDSASVLGMYGKRQLVDKEQVMNALDDVKASVNVLGASKSLVYRGLQFNFTIDQRSVFIKMTMEPDEVRLLDNFSRSGVAQRMENWVNDIEHQIAATQGRIERSKKNIYVFQGVVGKPFEQIDDLKTAIEEHGKVQRALMKSNSMAAVKPADAKEFELVVSMQKERLIALGFGVAVAEIENADVGEVEVGTSEVALEPVQVVESPVLASVATAATVQDVGSVLGDIPKSVIDKVQWALGQLRAVEGALVGVERARGRAHFLALEAKDQEAKLVRPKEVLAEFEKHAVENGVDAQAVLAELGGVPDLARFAVDQVLDVASVAGSVPAAVELGDMGLYIKVAADSIGELRKTDVYRVLVESNRAELRMPIAEFIKKNRPDLVQEVDDVLAEVGEPAKAPGVASGPVGVSAGNVASVDAVASVASVVMDHGTMFFEGLPVPMQKKLANPAITLRSGETVSRKDYVDGLLKNGYSEASYFAAAKGSHVGFVVHPETGDKVTLDAEAIYYADRVLMSARKDRASVKKDAQAISEVDGSVCVTGVVAPAEIAETAGGPVLSSVPLQGKAEVQEAMPVDHALLTAARLLSTMTNGRNDIYALAGRDCIGSRVKLMSVLLNRDKVPQAEAGVNAIRDELYTRAGIDTSWTPRATEDNFNRWMKANVVPVGVDVGTVPSKALFGMSGAQIEGWQGGKLKGAADFPGVSPTQARIEEREHAVSLAKENEAAQELKAGDDSLVNDLLRIHDVKMPVLASVAEQADVQPIQLVDDFKTRMVDKLSVDVPPGWIVMNAPRPLLGNMTMQGDFVTGRYYAAIDPEDSMAAAYVRENSKLDARLLAVVSRDTQMEMAMHGSQYRARYMEREPDERYEWLSSPLEKFIDMPFGELSKAILQARGVVNEDRYSGKILSVENNVAVQKINREGACVQHDLSKLSVKVKVNDVVDILYQGGQGIVGGLNKCLGVGL